VVLLARRRFVYSCGLTHFLKVLVTHVASYDLYVAVIAVEVLTAAISLAFVCCTLAAARNLGIKIGITRGPPGLHAA
jgi:hypothetical protein